MTTDHHHPGEAAPVSGTYEQHNVFGTPTGRRQKVREGEPLPSSPIGHSWVLVKDE
jgi:hypothetical protein